MKVEVRQAELIDRPAIAEFITEAYEEVAPYKGADRWEWQFVQNPYCAPYVSEGKVPVWIALENGKVVGQIAVQKAQIWLKGDVLDAGWIVDVMILPSHRGLKLGHRMHDCCAATEKILVTLTMAPATRRIAERAGCITYGPVMQFSRWQHLDSRLVHHYLLHRTITYPRIRRIAQLACGVFQFHHFFALIINPLLRMRDILASNERSAQGVKIEEVDDFGDEFDDLWSRLRSDYDGVFLRDSRFLKWRFMHCPQLVYRKFLARRDGKATGYVILREAERYELPLGIIVDLFASRSDEETIEQLIRFSIDFFGRRVAALDCAASILEMKATLRKHGFFVSRTMRPTCVCTDESKKATLNEVRNDFHFSKGDHDWDQIHLFDW